MNAKFRDVWVSLDGIDDLNDWLSIKVSRFAKEKIEKHEEVNRYDGSEVCGKRNGKKWKKRKKKIEK